MIKKYLYQYVRCVYSLHIYYLIRKKISSQVLLKIVTIILLPLAVLKCFYLYLQGGNGKKKENYDNFISFVAIVKNEGNYIEEWIEYHKKLFGGGYQVLHI